MTSAFLYADALARRAYIGLPKIIRPNYPSTNCLLNHKKQGKRIPLTLLCRNLINRRKN